jgi:Calcineurin-like phosphoesterase
MMAQRAFGDPQRTPDNFSGFTPAEMAGEPFKDAPADSALGPVPTARSTEPMDLANVLGTAAVTRIAKTDKKIVLHVIGDSGGVTSPQYQFAVADALAADQQNGVSLLYHLGDVVYFFGEDSYYFEQFYDPYRSYNAPIFAIPGNHDGAMYAKEAAQPLQGFLENFCSTAPTDTPDNQGCVRTTMDQPGVYFTLNAPFIKFIGLYSNIGEGGTSGVIASTRRTDIGTKQLDFLKAALTEAKDERDAGNYRVLALATHHPPFTGSPFHVPSPGMLKMIDKVCDEVGIYPDIHLSGHSHLYERFTRTIKGRQIPYIVSGNAGYPGLPGLKKFGTPAPVPNVGELGKDASGNPLKLETFNNKTFGYLRVTVSATELDVVAIGVDPDTGESNPLDGFSVDLKSGVVTDTQNIPANSSLAQTASIAAKKRRALARKAGTKAASKTASKKAAKKAPGRRPTH